MNTIKMEVNKKGAGNKYEKVGEVEIFVPTLSEIFPDAKIAVDKEGKPVEEDGLPVYEDAKLNWVQGAIFAAVKAQARNKLKPGTATLKDNVSIAKDWDTLTAEGERVGNGDALAAVREAKAAFAEYVKGLGKSAAAMQTLNLLFANKQALALQSPENKAKMEAYVTEFATSMAEDETKFARYEKYIASILAACEVSADANDF